MCWGMYVCTCGCVHMCLLKRAKKHPHMFRCAQGGCAVISIQFYGVPFCKQPPPPLLRWDMDDFFPVIACPCPLSSHFSVLWLITSLSGPREGMCCTSLPGCLPSPTASASPSEVCSPFPAQGQDAPAAGPASPRAAPESIRGPSAGATQGRQRGGGEGRGEADFPASGAASRREQGASVYLDTSSKAAVLGSICRGCQDP